MPKSQSRPTLAVATFNVRIDVPVDGANRWSNRLPLVARYLNESKIPVFGLQEPGPGMMQDLLSSVPRLRAVGRPRDSRGEGNPICYDPHTLDLRAARTFWLTPTPEVESTLPGSHFPRIVVIADFADRAGRPFRFANTHLDYASPDVRARQAEVLLRLLDDLPQAAALPTVLCGDFNAPPDEPLFAALRKAGFLSVYGDQPPASTFHGFDAPGAKATIDYILVRGFAVRSWYVHADRPEGKMLSDHDPVEAELLPRFRQ